MTATRRRYDADRHPRPSGLLSNDSDVDGDGLTVTGFTVDGTSYSAGDTANLTDLTINADGSTFTPAADYNGPVPDLHRLRRQRWNRYRH